MNLARISIVVEDVPQVTIVENILQSIRPRLEVTRHIKHGKQAIISNINGYKAASVHAMYMVLVDGDGCNCPVQHAREICGDQFSNLPNFSLTVITQQVEAWILADKACAASYFGIRESQISEPIEDIRDPKRFFLQMLSNSSKRHIREGMVPKPGAHIGRTYNNEVISFIQTEWDYKRAMLNSPSLKKLVDRIRRLPN